MTSTLTDEWRTFRDDAPGQRFTRHHQRMRRQGTRVGAIARLALGGVLIGAGIVMLFIPGPGLLIVLFGLALLGGESAWLAARLDRAEPVARRGGRRGRQWWSARSRPAQGVLAAATGIVLGFVAVSALRWLIG